MSWATCYSGSNNIHKDYPALMSDGRLGTNYDPSCEYNERLGKQNNIKTNYQYRQFLIHNADKLMKVNQSEACDQCGTCKYGTPLQGVYHGKYLYKSASDMNTPYGYERSDLKNMYLSRQALESRLEAPIMSQQSYLLNRYPNSN
jgi:hypothetical protein